MGDDEDEKHNHFNFEKIVEMQNLSKKKKKKLQKKGQEDLPQDHFQVSTGSGHQENDMRSISLDKAFKYTMIYCMGNITISNLNDTVIYKIINTPCIISNLKLDNIYIIILIIL